MGTRSRILVATFCTILIGAGGLVVYKVRSGNTANQDTPGSRTPGNTIYSPTTEEERKETEQFKKELEANQNSASQPTNQSGQGKITATVVITSLQFVEQTVKISGFVSNVFEDGGTCTLSLSATGQTVEATSQGVADVNKSSCPEISIPKTSLKSGVTYTAKLSYTSSAASGTSQSQTIQVK